MDLYEPLNTLKPIDEDLWIVDGPVIRMSYLGGSFPFPTRMAVVRLEGGDLFLWSPTELVEGLRQQIDALGPVRHLVSPNKLHYAHIPAWKRVYPEALAWASPGVRERAASRRVYVSFDADLGGAPEQAWREDLDQLIFRGSRLLEEIVFFHRKTRTVILADLIENFEPGKLGGAYGWLARLAGAADPDGKTPIDLRMTFLGRRRLARTSLAQMLAWEPDKIIIAHGRPYEKNGMEELQRAFRWLGPVQNA
ncbi:MAG TPA: DUF4336 domain-containing protein [Rubrobacteraceae bacterium]|nr:DUF4336 domain-containing protein [Rubrobacteraceae bacterium]